MLRKLASQTAVYGLSSIVGRLLNYLLVPFYTRIFTQQEYGVVTELYAYVVFLIVLLTFGMETAYFRHIQDADDKKKVYGTAFFSLLVSSSLFVLLCSLFSGSIAGLLHYEKHPDYIIYFAIIVGIDVLSSIVFAKLRQENRAMRFAIIRLTGIFTNIFFNILFIIVLPRFAVGSVGFLSNFNDTSYLLQWVFIANVMSSLIMLLMLMPDMRVKTTHFSLPLFKQMGWYGFPILVAGLAGSINEVLDRIAMKYLLTIPAGETNSYAYIMKQIGVYGANYKLSILMTLFIQTFRYSFEPFLFNYSKHKDSREIYAKVMHYFSLFCIAIFLFVMLYIDVLKSFIGTRFHDGLVVVPILLLANMFLGIYYNLSVWYKLSGKTRYGAYISLGGAALTLVMNIILVPIISYLGAAIATLACYMGMAVASYLIGQKQYNVPYRIKTFALYAIFAGALYACSFMAAGLQFWLKIALNTVFLAAFAGVVLYKEKIIQPIVNTLRKRK